MERHEEMLPMQFNAERTCEFFKSEEDFLAALQSSSDTYPALTWFYACRVMDTEDGTRFCKATEYLHITISAFSPEYNRVVKLVAFGKEEFCVLTDSTGKHLLCQKQEELEKFWAKQAELSPSSIVEASELPLAQSDAKSDRAVSRSLKESVTPISLEEARARIPQQEGKSKVWKSWLLLSHSEILAFEEKARQQALATNLILPSHLIADGCNHGCLTTSDKAKGRKDGDTSNNGSYKYTVESNGFRKIVWNSYNGVGGSYTIAQFMKEAPRQEMTGDQIKRIEEQAERRRIAFERKRDLQEAKAEENRAKWAMLYNASDGTIQDCQYLKAKNFPLAEIEKVLMSADVRYDQDGTLRIPYRHSSPEYADSYAGHQAINPAADPEKSFGRGADCGKDGNFIWSFLPSDDGRNSNTYLCEGLATGLSIWLATHGNVLVCFNAGGLVKVAKGLADKRLPVTWQTSRFFICADNDCEGKGNTGLDAALRASQVLDCSYFLPIAQGKKCDFDDLRMWQGIEAVKEQLQDERGVESPKTSRSFTNTDKATEILRPSVADRPTDFAIPLDMLGEAQENEDIGMGEEGLIEESISVGEAKKPFPMEALPCFQIREAIRQRADMLGRPVDPFCAAFLYGCAVLIGNLCRLQPREDWLAKPILSFVLIARSSAGKGLVFKYMFDYFRKKDAEGEREYKKAMEKWEIDIEEWKEALREWKRKGDFTPRPQRPPKPTLTKLTVQDATLEGLIQTNIENPRGIGFTGEEAESVFMGFGQYSKNGNAGKKDKAQFIDLVDGNQTGNARISEGSKRFIAEDASLINVFTATQTERLTSIFGYDDLVSGLFARLNFCYFKSDAPKPYSERKERVDEEYKKYMKDLFSYLHSLPLEKDDRGNYSPLIFTFSPEAQKLWEDKDHELQSRAHKEEKDSCKEAILGKCSQAFLSVILILHCITAFEKDRKSLPQKQVEAETIRRAIAILEWIIWGKMQALALWRENKNKKETAVPMKTHEQVQRQAIFVAYILTQLRPQLPKYSNEAFGDIHSFLPTKLILEEIKRQHPEMILEGLGNEKELGKYLANKHYLHLRKLPHPKRYTDKEGKSQRGRGYEISDEKWELIEKWAKKYQDNEKG